MLVISYGGGVNSTAMIVHLLQTEPEAMQTARIVFADTGAEWPETYAYVHQFDGWLQGQGLRIEWVSNGSLVDYCRQLSVMPVRMNRFCTRIFKQVPICRWRDAEGLWGEKAVECIGFAADEAHRAMKTDSRLVVSAGDTSGYNWHRTNFRYPLIEAGLDRHGCGRVLLAAGLGVPPKSGCWCCAFQRVSEFRRLWRDHPDLFERACEIEDASASRRAENGAAPVFIKGDQSLRSRAAAWANEQTLFADEDFVEAHPCRCGL